MTGSGSVITQDVPGRRAGHRPRPPGRQSPAWQRDLMADLRAKKRQRNMCGIVGILGITKWPPPGRGAAGGWNIAAMTAPGSPRSNDGRLDRRRAVGKLVNLSDMLVHEPLAGKSGIGHTRWATHGAPTVSNAHPHRPGPWPSCITASSRISANCAPIWRNGHPARDRDRHRNRRAADAALHGAGLSPVEAARRRWPGSRAPSRWRSCSTAKAI